jgi:hypothetical protein
MNYQLRIYYFVPLSTMARKPQPKSFNGHGNVSKPKDLLYFRYLNFLCLIQLPYALEQKGENFHIHVSKTNDQQAYTYFII